MAGKCRGLFGQPYPDPNSLQTVQQSFKNHQDKVAEQNHINQSGELLASLCFGLAKLINVRNVKMGMWDDFTSPEIDRSNRHLDLPLSPSPLARSWNVFQLMPEAPIRGHDREFNNIISSMFSSTGRCL